MKPPESLKPLNPPIEAITIISPPTTITDIEPPSPEELNAAWLGELETCLDLLWNARGAVHDLCRSYDGLGKCYLTRALTGYDKIEMWLNVVHDQLYPLVIAVGGSSGVEDLIAE